MIYKLKLYEGTKFPKVKKRIQLHASSHAAHSLIAIPGQLPKTLPHLSASIQIKFFSRRHQLFLPPPLLSSRRYLHFPVIRALACPAPKTFATRKFRWAD